MFCTNCGTAINNSISFCTNCGNKNNLSIAEMPENKSSETESYSGETDYLDESYFYKETSIGEKFNTYKKYLVLAIFLFFLWSLKDIVKVKGEGGVGGKTELDGISGNFKFTGWQMFTDDLPKFSFIGVRNGKEMDDRNIINNAELENSILDAAEREGSINFKKIARTPLHFRLSYLTIAGSILVLLFSIFFVEKKMQKTVNSLAVVVGFIGIVTFMWSYNEFEIYGEKIIELASRMGQRSAGFILDIKTSFSFSIWMLLLLYGALFTDYIIENLKSPFINNDKFNFDI